MKLSNSPSSSTKIKETWSYTATPHVFMEWNLVKHRNKFTYYFSHICLYTSNNTKTDWFL